MQIVRDWVKKFNALGPDGLLDRKAFGQHCQALAVVIESGPIRWAPRDQRTASTYIFGAICPKDRRPRPAHMQPRADEPASGRNRDRGRAKQAYHLAARPGRLASIELVYRSTTTS